MTLRKQNSALPLLLITGLLLLSLCSYGQQRKQVPKVKPPAIPVISRADNGLGGSRWQMTVDTSGKRTILEFRRIKGNASVPFLVQFINGNAFLLTVKTPQCSFRARGTCDITFPASSPREGEIELAVPGGFRFDRYNTQGHCAEKLKKKIGNTYTVTHRDDDSFSLEEELISSITIPAGQ